jgi:hypothetical protein
MNLRSIFSGIFLLIVTVSCNNRQNVENVLLTIDVESNINNMQQINLSRFADNIRYIALENRKDIAIGDYPSVDISDNLIITSDRESSLLIFDISGRLVVKFGKIGRGPEEYQSIKNLCFGKDNKVYFNGMYDLFEFDQDGSFAGKDSKCLLVENKFYLHQWGIVEDSLIFGHIQNDSGQTRYKAIMIDKYGKVRHYYQNHDLLENRGSRIAGGTTQIFKFNGKLYFKEQFNDTLFSLNADYELIPEYCFNLGNLKMPASVRVNFYEYFEKINDYVAIEDIFQTEDYLFLKVNFGNKFPAKRLTASPVESPVPGIVSTNSARVWTNTTFCLGIYDKKTFELQFCKPTSTDNPLFTSGIYNDIDAGPRFFPRKLINDSTMVMTISARDFKYHIASDDFKNNIPRYPEKKRQLEELANSLSEFDNPVLMVVTFKRK